MQNVNKKKKKKGSIMKYMAFWREKRRVCSMFKILRTYICLKYIYKMQQLEDSSTPVLYIGRRFLKVKKKEFLVKWALGHSVLPLHDEYKHGVI
jgi:hypothetical protein